MKTIYKLFILAALVLTLSAQTYVLIPGTLQTTHDFLLGVLYGSVKGTAKGDCDTIPNHTSLYSEAIVMASCPFNVEMEASGTLIEVSTIGSDGYLRTSPFPPAPGMLLREVYGYINCYGQQASSGSGTSTCYPE